MPRDDRRDEPVTALRVGLVCPYAWDVPGGVGAHVRDLAEALIALGHEVSVLAPVDDRTGLPGYIVPAGRAVPVRYNGSVARLQFGPVAASRVRRWLREGHFDVLHVHEPVAPSISLLAIMLAHGPIVATFHTSNQRSRSLAAAGGVLQPFLERIAGRIAVSAAARKVQVEHLGGDAIEIPNGVSVQRYAAAVPLPGYPRPGGTVGFIGRYDEPRKGMRVLLAAMDQLVIRRPDLRLLVVGAGDQADLLAGASPRVRGRIDFMGQCSDDDKARMLASLDVYCAPNLGGESFGVILLEAMAAGAAIVASDLPPFLTVLGGGSAGAAPRELAGRTFRTGDPGGLAAGLEELLTRPALRAELAARGRRVVRVYDWPVVARSIVQVYETVIAVSGTSLSVVADDSSG